MPESDRITSEARPSRRSMLRGAAGIGAAGLAASAIGGLAAAPALAATGRPAAAADKAAGPRAQRADAAEPVVVHVRDARTGELDVFRGTTQFRLRDRDLAARLLQAGQ